MSFWRGDRNRPLQVNAAIGLWSAAAIFLLVQAGSAWSGRDLLVSRVAARRGVGPAEAAGTADHLLLVNLGVAVGLAVLYAGLAMLLLRRRPWARWLLTVLVALHLVMVLGAGAMSVPNLIGFTLIVGALVLVWSPRGSEWITGEHD